MENKQPNNPILRALILVPTRELATQIAKAVEDYAKYLDIEKLAVFGGVSAKEQEKEKLQMELIF